MNTFLSIDDLSRFESKMRLYGVCKFQKYKFSTLTTVYLDFRTLSYIQFGKETSS